MKPAILARLIAEDLRKQDSSGTVRADCDVKGLRLTRIDVLDVDLIALAEKILTRVGRIV